MKGDAVVEWCTDLLWANMTHGNAALTEHISLCLFLCIYVDDNLYPIGPNLIQVAVSLVINLAHHGYRRVQERRLAAGTMRILYRKALLMTD